MYYMKIDTFIYFYTIVCTMEIKVNVSFRNLKKWSDSEKRAEHVFDRMRSRGIGVDNVMAAVRKGAKRIRKDGSVMAEYRWFGVAYREFVIGKIRKVYPITVIEL